MGRTCNTLSDATIFCALAQKWEMMAYRILTALFLTMVALPHGQAQITNLTDQTSTPIPNVGHDYIGLFNETVNPANGSVSIDMRVPTPPSGVGPTIPAGIAYSSNQTYQISPWGAAGTVELSVSGTDASVGGWSMYGPYLSISTNVASQLVANYPPTYAYCYYLTNFVFVDRQNNAHPLNLAWQPQNNCGGMTPPPHSVTSGGDTFVTASLGSNVTVTEKDGTQYIFSLPNIGTTAGQFYTELPTSITDVHGNQAIATFTQGVSNSQDASFPSAIQVNGMSSSYSIGWGRGGSTTGTWNPNFAQVVNDGSASCGIPSSVNAYSAGVGSFALPNGHSYTFTYDQQYGTIQQVTYPTGATVSYTWTVPSQQGNVTNWADSLGSSSLGCVYKYGLPQVNTRIVTYDGTTPAEEQIFSYTTSWNTTTPYMWDTKTTTVWTYDCTRASNPSSCATTAPGFKTVYTYAPCNSCTPGGNNDPDHQSITYYPNGRSEGSGFLQPQIPLESQIQYYDWNGKLLRTVTKSFGNQYVMNSVQTQLPSGQTSLINYSNYCDISVPSNEMDYDFGPGSYGGLLKNKVLTAATGYTGRLANACIPSSVATYDYTNSLVLAAQSNYEHNSLGDLTSATDCLLVSGACSSASPKTSYQYDSAGRIVGKTDPCGNGTCSDLASGSGATAAPTPSGGECPNSLAGTPGAETTTYSYECLNAGDVSGAPLISYLYAIQPPSTGAGVNHGRVYQYDAASGQLTSSKDENGNSTTYEYNASMSRISAIIGPPDPNNSNMSAEISYGYTDDAPSPTVTTSQTLNAAGQAMTTVETEDGIGHQVSSAITTDPVAPDYVKTTYDGLGHIYKQSNPYRSTSDPTYGVVTHTYDALGRNVLELAQDGTSLKQWCYDGQPSVGQTNCRSHLGSVTNGTWVDYTDENGNSWQMTYNALGELMEVIEPNGSSLLETDYGYDHALGVLTSVTQCGGGCPSAASLKRRFFYNSLGQLVASQNPENASALAPASLTCGQGAGPGWTACYAYDLNGNLITKMDNRGISSSFTYDALNRVLSKSYSDGTPPTTYSYDTSTISGATNTVGRLTQEAVVNGTTVVAARFPYSYDVSGNLTAELQCSPANCSGTPYNLTYSYDLSGHVTATSNGVATNPISLSYQYDTANRLSGVISNLAESIVYPRSLFDATSVNPPAYGPLGLLNASLGTNFTSGAVAGIQARTYDKRQRLLSETVQSVTTTPGRASTGTIAFSGAEQVHAGTSAAPGVGHVYLSGGPANPTSPPQVGTVYVTVNGRVSSAQYNPGATATSLASSLASSINNPSANIAASSSGTTITISSTITGASTNYPVSCSVSVSSGQSTFTVGCSSMTGGTDQTPTTHDSGTVTVTINGSPATCSYRNGSTPSQIAFGIAGLLNRKDNAFLTASSSGSVVTVTGNGNSADINWPISASVSFNTNYFSSPSFAAAPSGMSGGSSTQYSNPQQVYSYNIPQTGGYDKLGNLASVSDYVTGTWSYTYDNLNRLLSGTATSGKYAGKTLCWAYDPFSNRTAQSVSTSACPSPESSVPPTVKYNGNNQVTWVSNSAPNGFQYDAAGNVLNDVTNNYLYDAEGRLCASQNVALVGNYGPMIGYIYDAEGRRVAKGTLTSWSCNINSFVASSSYVLGLSGEQVSELSISGTPQNGYTSTWKHTNVFAGGQLLATYTGTDTYFALKDWVGTKRGEFTPDGQKAYYFSLPYGDDPSQSGNAMDATEHHFTGKERDPESGNDYFGARYYASTMGRWLSPDPSGLAYADPTNPQSLNLYSYVLNNPLVNVDPDGQQCVWDDGSFDSADDKQTGNAAGCQKAGGTYFDPSTFTAGGMQDWSATPNAELAAMTVPLSAGDWQNVSNGWESASVATPGTTVGVNGDTGDTSISTQDIDIDTTGQISPFGLEMLQQLQQKTKDIPDVCKGGINIKAGPFKGAVAMGPTSEGFGGFTGAVGKGTSNFGPQQGTSKPFSIKIPRTGTKLTVGHSGGNVNSVTLDGLKVKGAGVTVWANTGTFGTCP